MAEQQQQYLVALKPRKFGVTTPTKMWILGVPFKLQRKRRTKERDALLSGYITETTGVRAAPARAEQTWRAP